MGIAHKGGDPKTPACEGEGTQGPWRRGTTPPCAESWPCSCEGTWSHWPQWWYATVRRLVACSRRRRMLHDDRRQYRPHHRDLQVGDRADRCCTGVHHCVCRSSKLEVCRPDELLNNYGIIVYLLPAWFLRNCVVRFLPCCCPRGFQISSILVSKLAFSAVFMHFSGDRRHVDFGPSAELTRQVEKSTRRAYQAPIPVDLLHEQAHKLMSSMALSRLDVLGLSTDHSLHRLNSVAADSSDTTSRRRITFSKTQCLHSCIPGDGATACQVSLLSRCLQFCWVCLLPAWFLR